MKQVVRTLFLGCRPRVFPPLRVRFSTQTTENQNYDCVAAQLRATFSRTCEDYYDLTTIDSANKCSFSLTFLVLSVVLSELGCGSCFSHFQHQCQNLHEHLLDKH